MLHTLGHPHSKTGYHPGIQTWRKDTLYQVWRAQVLKVHVRPKETKEKARVVRHLPHKLSTDCGAHLGARTHRIQTFIEGTLKCSQILTATPTPLGILGSF